MRGRNLGGGVNTCRCFASTKSKLASLKIFKKNCLEIYTVILPLDRRIVFVTLVSLHFMWCTTDEKRYGGR